MTDTETPEVQFLVTLLAAFLFRTGSLLSREQVDMVHRAVFGTQVNGTALRRAKTLLEQPVRDRTADGLRWVQAYVSLYPEVSPSIVEQQYAQRFQQQIGPAVVRDLRKTPVPPALAAATLAEIEARLRAGQPTFFPQSETPE